MLSFTLKVVEIRSETSDTVTVCFKQPGLKKIKYLPGQYLTLIFRINGRKYIRPYSFSSAPGVDPYLEVTIKRVPGGVVSNHVNDFLKVDELVEVIQPMGDFVLNNEMLEDNRHIVLWGAGSGITPLISIAKYVLNTNTGNKVTLVYGNKNFESVIFKNKITELENQYPETLDTWHFYTQLKIAENNSEIIEGRISPERILAILKQQVDIQNTVHFICGPTGLKQSVKETLKELSVDDDAIFTEEFETIKNPEDFKDITTRLVEFVKNGVGF
jgi:ring-1,2-phenylacetyl-CoA epoxidase subunit PaaE